MTTADPLLRETSDLPQTPLSWKPIVEGYTQPHVGQAVWQIVNSVGLYIALWVAMWLTVSISWWLTIPIAMFAGCVLVRVFIILHDCGHGSFFASRNANEICGFLTGVLTFTPYTHWRWQHAIHHGTTGNLDRRGSGDIWTMTVEEYRKSRLGRRLRYRIARNPIVLLAIAPLVMQMFAQRVAHSQARGRELNSVRVTNVAVVAMAIGLSFVFGIVPYLIIQAVILQVAGAIGIWLFYSQHQFEDTYWERGENWGYTEAALKGSTFLRLPKPLQWLTGNIGFHHIHHLSARIPNYNLQACHESHSVFESVAPVSALRSIRFFGLKLWDETSGKLISFQQLRTGRGPGLTQ